MAQNRNWCFTVNNPEDQLFPDEDGWAVHCSYVTWQLELGESGTLHFQGYLECVGKKSVAQLKTLDGLERAHLEVRRGTQAQAIAYVQKADTRVEGPWEWGTPKEQGKRSDLLDMKRRLDDDNVPIQTLWDENFGSMIRYHRSFKEYKRIKTRPRNWVPDIYVIIGPSGIGKSRLARQMFPDAYWKTNSKWWDDYDSHSSVIWDEFKGQYPFQDLLRVLDSTPLLVETKGSSVQYTADTICFTSNFHPSEWYNPENIHFAWQDSPLNRRLREFGHIIDLTPAPVLGLIPGRGDQPILGNAINFVP